jgi:uncharacterized protein YndB with AHSA1/START domain
VIYALWILQVLLAALFLFAGGMKLVTPIAEMTKEIAMPGWFLRFIGVVEVLGALGLVLPGLFRIRQGLTALAAAGLVLIMIGATVLTLMTGSVAMALIPLVVGLLAAFVAYGRWRLMPADFRIARTTTMAAPAPAVFAHVNDFHNWRTWNPWGKLDPAMKQTYVGAPAGAGAVYTWVGNGKVGQGRMTVTESRPSELIRIKLEFLKPFAATNTAEFTFKPAGGDRTVVTWSMAGCNTFMGKAMSLVMDMDRMIGKNFERGLADMKSVVEGGKQ